MAWMKFLFKTNSVKFIAGRKFLFNGVTYNPGDNIPKATLAASTNREAIVRSRRAIPVVVDLNTAPRSFQREVKDRAVTFRKLNRTYVAP